MKKKIKICVVILIFLVMLGYLIIKKGNLHHINTQWGEGPPHTISSNCWSMCMNEETVSWQEYVDRYHASKMKLDQPE